MSLHAFIITIAIWLTINIACFVLILLVFWPQTKRPPLPDYLRRAL